MTDEEYDDVREELKRNAIQKRGRGGLARQDEQEAPAAEPIVYEDVVCSFCEGYEARSASTSDARTEFWTLGDLRQHFAAVVPFGLPDAMPEILSLLKQQGFRLQHVPGFSEPVMPVRFRPFDYDEADDDGLLSL